MSVIIDNINDIEDIPNIRSTAQLAGFKNKLINGGFNVWQRGTSFVAGTNRFTADRWFCSTIVTASKSGEAPLNTPFAYSLAIKSTAANYVGQGIELPDIGKTGIFYVGNTLTLSFYAKVPLGEPVNLFSGFREATDGSGISVPEHDGTTNIGTGTGDWEYYTFTWTVTVSPDAGSNQYVIFPKLGTDATNVYSYIVGVQLEEGSVATQFENRPIGAELALCQRYYNTLVGNEGGGNIFSSYVIAGTQYYLYCGYPVQMRANPTISISSSSGAGFPANTAIVNLNTIKGVRFQNSTDGSSNGGYFTVNFTADAEL